MLSRPSWNLLNEISSLLDGTSGLRPAKDDSRVEGSRWIPAVDIKETPHEFLLYVDVPGVQAKDLDISMEHNVLTIKGTREETHRDDLKDYHRIERIKGVFYRRFTLPDTADANQIHASSKHGVLEVSIGKKEIAKARKISVDVKE